MSTTFTIAIDWDRNDNYIDTYDNVTTRVIQVNWLLGMRKEYQGKADNSMLAMVLRNDDRRYSPENATSPLFGKVAPQSPVRIQSFDGTTTRTHWVSWIEAIKPAVGKFGERTLQILASGAAQFYSQTETKLQENKRTDEIIAELIKEVVTPPALNRAWVLGRAGNEAEYYVIGEAHELTHGATLWKTTWYLEPAPQAAALPWKLGVTGRSELGAATMVTY